MVTYRLQGDARNPALENGDPSPGPAAISVTTPRLAESTVNVQLLEAPRQGTHNPPEWTGTRFATACSDQAMRIWSIPLRFRSFSQEVATGCRQNVGGSRLSTCTGRGSRQNPGCPVSCPDFLSMLRFRLKLEIFERAPS